MNIALLFLTIFVAVATSCLPRGIFDIKTLQNRTLFEEKVAEAEYSAAVGWMHYVRENSPITTWPVSRTMSTVL
ncbi:hypothetical protein K458DRAFT_152064 [Lentithecium fluviatile CBS 122367]|uniref:Uncharacterized protein n=1 Tax=Lentithecium fluviatile CBS 122367 TaxID=1168545 RepID=A0A6G1JF28_9PLEO|nr:hypothetical protein K458DRAFT_152064 [Lentithecium fluviatile CBS 122367]